MRHLETFYLEVTWDEEITGATFLTQTRTYIAPTHCKHSRCILAGSGGVKPRIVQGIEKPFYNGDEQTGMTNVELKLHTSTEMSTPHGLCL